MRMTSFAWASAVTLAFAACTTSPAVVASPAPSSTAAPTAGLPTASQTATTTTQPPGFQIVEDLAWVRLREVMPAEVPMPRPTWLPDGADPVVYMNASMEPMGYEVTYMRGSDVLMRLAVGTSVAVGTRIGSGIGTRVRGVGASLDFSTDLFTRPGGRGQRRLTWTEGRFGIALESEVVTGDALLHVGWSIDRAGAPPARLPATHQRPGSCASRNSATETVSALVGAIGEHDRELVRDCFSLDLIGDSDGWANWADLPTAVIDSMAAAGTVGGRPWIRVTWQFTRDPGNLWTQGQRSGQFLMLGLEDGYYRVFEYATAPYGPPP
jgi:hypothetical protein